VSASRVSDHGAAATLVASQFANFGILKMTLKASSWTYQWISATGGTFTDASTSEHRLRLIRRPSP
jgi:hypothetical protein